MAGKPFDPYNFSEIEKIQSDIERDLNYSHTKTDTADTADATDATVVADSTVVADTAVVVPAKIADDFSTDGVHSDNFSAGSTREDGAHEGSAHADSIRGGSIRESNIHEGSFYEDNFYIETIKQETPLRPVRAKSYRRLVVTLLIVCTLGTGTLGIGLGFAIVFLQQRTGISGQIAGNNLADDTATAAIGSSRLIFGGENDGQQEGTLADVVRLVDPAVARITPRFGNQSPFPFAMDGGARNRDGSGIIFSVENGYIFIVTNNHVIRGADSVDISIMDAGPFQASLIGRDVGTDLAVLSITLADVRRAGISDVVIAAFGDSDTMQVGDVVLAIGNAMGEGNSTTSGIISAGEKEIIYGGNTLRVFQTDAAINPGSSGGPLVNKQGEVIGINTVAGSTDHYAIEGMGFSIPSNVATPVIEQIMNQTPRPFLGIEGKNVDDQIAAHYGIPPIGIFVEGIVPGTGAEAAGIRAGDIITSFNGRAVFNMNQLVEEITRCEVGDTVDVMVIRGGRNHLVFQVTLGENPLDNF